MNANQISALKTINIETVRVNGDVVSSLSDAVVAVCHVADHTESHGIRCSVSRAAVDAWESLPEDDRRELWDLGCAGRLDHALEPDPQNVVAIR
ncbi:MAG: hypothetical protein WDA27_15390 [Actinomycetota bacterium]